MPVEAGNFISNLDQSWPLSQDGVNEGDNHLRLIKKILQSQFPGSEGEGFNKVITASEDELNRLVGVTSKVQAQIDAIVLKQSEAEDSLFAPQGVMLVFGEANVPTGWTLQSYGLVSNLVIIDPSVDNSPGWQGGTANPTSLNWTHRHKLRVSTSHKAQAGEDLFIVGDEYTDNNISGLWEPRYIEAVIARKD